MKSLVKFGDPDNGTEITHPNLWEREDGDGWSRLVIGAESRKIPLMLEICKTMQEPFWVLYVLVVTRLGREPGRYQCVEPMTYDDLELFLYTFQEFFEQDGRHHIWVSSAEDKGTLVFDQHNVVYAYGDLEKCQQVLTSSSFEPGKVTIPTPHAHHYHAQFDSSEDEVMDYCKWAYFELQPEDEL